MTKFCNCNIHILDKIETICSKCGYIIHTDVCLYCKRVFKNNFWRSYKQPPSKYCSRKCYGLHKKILIAEGKIKMPEKDFRYRAQFIKGKTFKEFYGEEKAKEIRDKCIIAHTGKPHPTTHRWSEAEKERRRREILDDPVRMRKIKETRAKQVFPFYNSSIEILVRGMLDAYGIKYMKHKPISDIQDPYACDIFIPILNMVIECDGDYFHGVPAKSERDKRRTKEMREKGYIVLRFWETTIRKNPQYICETIEKILKIISPDQNLNSAKELLNTNFEKYQEQMKQSKQICQKRYNIKHREELREKRKQKTQERIEYRTINNIKFECQQCHREFVPKERNFKRRTPKYCNIECRNKAMSQPSTKIWKINIGIRKQSNDCPECLKLESGFCSYRCRHNYKDRVKYWRNKGVDFKYQNEIRPTIEVI